MLGDGITPRGSDLGSVANTRFDLHSARIRDSETADWPMRKLTIVLIPFSGYWMLFRDRDTPLDPVTFFLRALTG